jgi:putative two-component system response regulator
VRTEGRCATRDIPVIFLTAMSATDDESAGLELGAADYITKPISPPIVLARVRTQLKLKAAADFLRDQNAFLEQEVPRARARWRDPGRHHPGHGLAGRDARQRNRQPHPPHPALRAALAEHLREHPRFRHY